MYAVIDYHCSEERSQTEVGESTGGLEKITS
jgi:hypothetical protein